jgi:hypothetical protein
MNNLSTKQQPYQQKGNRRPFTDPIKPAKVHIISAIFRMNVHLLKKHKPLCNQKSASTFASTNRKKDRISSGIAQLHI